METTPENTKMHCEIQNRSKMAANNVVDVRGRLNGKIQRYNCQIKQIFQILLKLTYKRVVNVRIYDRRSPNMADTTQLFGTSYFTGPHWVSPSSVVYRVLNSPTWLGQHCKTN